MSQPKRRLILPVNGRKTTVTRKPKTTGNSATKSKETTKKPISSSPLLVACSKSQKKEKKDKKKQQLVVECVDDAIEETAVESVNSNKKRKPDPTETIYMYVITPLPDTPTLV